MDNLYNNITNKNNFYTKLTASSALLVFLIYLLSIILIPTASSIINTKNNTYVNTAKQYNGLANKVLVTKINNAASNTIKTATYANNGQMLARQIDNNNLQSYINDAKGSVLKLNSADKTNNQTYSYDAYGKPVANIVKPNLALNVINSFQYNGERFDNNTGLQYLRARFYKPETKRFLNQDSYDLLNKFGYVDGNPVMGIDPSGHIFESAIFSRKRFFSRQFNVRISGETVIITHKRGEKDFSGMNLSKANFSKARLSGKVNFSKANLREAVFTEAVLIKANFSKANLSRANLSKASLLDAFFYWANLSGADLSGANLSWSSFFGADLSGADLSEANLTKACFMQANLSGADLSGANLSWASFSGADLSGANLSGADLSGVDLYRANITDVIVDRNTIINTPEQLSIANLSGSYIRSWANDLDVIAYRNGILTTAEHFQSPQYRDLWDRVQHVKREMEQVMLARAVYEDKVAIPRTIDGPRGIINAFIGR